MELKFTGKPWKWGNSYVVRIPAAYIRNGLLELKARYEFGVIRKLEEEDKKK